METNLRLEAIKQAVLLVKDNDSIKNKNKAIFDLANDIYAWITPDIPVPEFVPLPNGTASPSLVQPWEVTCTTNIDGILDCNRDQMSVTYKTE